MSAEDFSFAQDTQEVVAKLGTDLQTGLTDADVSKASQLS